MQGEEGGSGNPEDEGAQNRFSGFNKSLSVAPMQSEEGGSENPDDEGAPAAAGGEQPKETSNVVF